MRETLLSYLPDFLSRGEATALMGRRGLRTVPWSYRRLAQTAFQVARELASRGLGKGDRVLLWEHNSPEWVAAFLGCLMRGVIVAPLDVQSSPAFIANVQRQVGARRLLGGSLPNDWEDAELPVESIEGFCRTAARHPPTPDWTYAGQIAADHVAEIVFTSGTTAAPKGIQLTHRNLLANLTPLEVEIQKYLKWEALVHPIRFLSLLPLSHVFGQFMGIFVPPLLGGQVLFLNSLNPSEIIASIRRERISVMAAVPRMLELLRDKVERDEASQSRGRALADRLNRNASRHWLGRWWAFRRIRRRFGWKFWAFVTGGAALGADTEDFWRKLGYAVVQGYGMTEAAAIISVSHPFRLSRGSIGKSMPGQEIKLDDRGQILVRGRNVSPGYWSPGEAPLTDREGWLRTGDLGESDARGHLFFRGRSKEVIVTSAGLNIFPGDLEAALDLQPEIGESAVIGVDGPLGPEPVAVLLMRRPDADAALPVQRANERLATHQQIRRWVVWPGRDFPRTATHKVRKRDLAPFVSRQRKEPASVGGGEAEDLLAEILQAIERITGAPPRRRDRQAHLTSDLKLDSLARVALITDLEDRFHLDLDEARVTAALTLGDLERLVGVSDRSPESHSLDGAPPAIDPAPDPPAPAGARPVQSRPPHDSATSVRTWRPYPYPYWALGRPATWVRFLFYHCLIRPLTFSLCWTRVRGRKHWRGLRRPVLLIANHVTFLDPALIPSCLPFRYRNRLAVAMIGETLRDFRHPPQSRGFSGWIGYLTYGLLTCGFNVFPLPKQSGFRRSFDYAGEAMDRGYSVLVFPEGRRTEDGGIQPFQSGIGLLAAGLRAPVIPVSIQGLYELKQRRRRGIPWPFAWPGQVSITFGPPLDPQPSSTPQSLTRELEERLTRLSRSNG